MTTSANTRGLVAVTGGSGHIAAYCIAELLGDGWRVRATLRDLARAGEVRAAIGKIASNADTIEFAPADLNSDAGWANALVGADYVLHIASPVSTKTIAERAAWTWQKTEGGALELVTVNPALVLGPALSPDFSPSLEAIRRLLDRSVPALPHIGFCVVDVRDTARLHLLAMTAPGVSGQRFIASSGFFWMRDIARILKAELGDAARNVPSFSMPDFIVRIFALFYPALRARLFELGKRRLVSSDKARRVLGWTTRPARDTFVETARSLQAQGLV
jgi:dihydroflavonol-4-reductase